MRWRGFKVDAQQLLLAPQHPQLDRGADIGVVVEPGSDACFLQQASQGLAGFIRADHR